MRIRYVNQLPDLITEAEYENAHCEKRIKVRIQSTAEGVELLVDSPYPVELDKILAHLDADIVEMLLCG